MTRHPRRSAAIAGLSLSLAVLIAGPSAARADSVACERAIVDASAKLLQTTAKALQRCRDKIVAGALASGTDCRTEPVTGAKLAAAQAKLRASIAKRCGGPDRDCATPGDNFSLASIGWDVGQCPGFAAGGCANAISQCGDVADCVACVADAAVDQATGLHYDALVETDDRTIDKCQRALGKAGVKFLVAKSKALDACAGAVLAGTSAGPCPDAPASAKIAQAEAKKVKAICAACGGADHMCGTGGDDLTPAAIGFAPACPAVTLPGGPSCEAPVASIQDVVACLDCVTRFDGDCAAALAAPGLGAYPAECVPNLHAALSAPASADANTPVLLDASASTGDVVHYVWRFGHGTASVTTTGPTVSHRFGAFGRFDVSVTVVDSLNASDTATVTIDTTGFGTDNYMVKPVYFVPTNRTPDPDYVTKFQTAMKLIYRFYAENLGANGYGYRPLNYEKDANGDAVVHLVHGQFDDQYYLPTGSYETGSASQRIQTELEAIFDLEKHCLLIISDVQWYDASIFQDVGPWSGGRAFPGRGGMGFVGSPLRWLGRTVVEQIATFNDHTWDADIGPRERGDNASILVGGMAHELGHAFGAQHTDAYADLMTGAAWAFRNYFVDPPYGGVPNLAPETALVFDNSAMFRSDHPFADNADPTIQIFPPLVAQGQPFSVPVQLADAQSGPALFLVYFNGVVADAYDVRGMGTSFAFPYTMENSIGLPEGNYPFGYIVYDGDSNRKESSASFQVVASIPPIPPAIAVDPGEWVWAEDARASDSYTIDYWAWQSSIKTSGNLALYQRTTPTQQAFHSWYGADPNPMPLQAGDRVTAYVYIVPASTLDGIAIEIGENIGGGIRLYWGNDTFDSNIWGSVSVRIGDLPPAGGWVTLSVPASTLGITTPRTYVNMGVRCAGTGTVFWDRLGKKPASP